ncbi:hypothetical protein ACWGCW_13825 [Streptomyces sp. NPDC054933]
MAGYLSVDDYEHYPTGDLFHLPRVDGAVEVELRGPAERVAAVRGWIEARSGLIEPGAAEYVWADDPERRGGTVCRMLVVPPEE